jgi:type VI secretion system protein ImpC
MQLEKNYHRPPAKGAGLESFDSHLVAVMDEAEATPADDTPFIIALISDWSGRGSRSVSTSGSELASRRCLIVDRDNLDQVMSKLGVKLHLPISNDGNLSLTVEFNQLADFHPDRLVERLDLFERLRRTRARLLNPATFAETAQEVRAWSSSNSPQLSSSQTSTRQESIEARADIDSGSLLDQILESSPPATSIPAPAAASISPEINELAQEAVKPYLVPDDDEERQLLAVVDEAISRELRAIMHQPRFQALEAAWRGLRFLTRRLETGSNLKLLLLDMSRQEFEADLLGENEIASTALYKILIEQSGASPWAVLCGNYEFDLTGADIQVLERASHLARAARAPFIAGAKSFPMVCESLAATPDPDDWKPAASTETEKSWQSLKELPSARYLGLAMPRFLVRLPYGEQTDAAEEFDFEEFPKGGPASHESYLWANPMFAIAYLLGKAFSESSWDLQPGDFSEIDGLPLHVYHQDGESRIKPCGETLLTVRAAQKLIALGFMPLITMKETDVVRLGLFQSISGTKLAGRWRSA